MTAETARQFEALERQAAALMSVFIEAGCEAVAPAIIQPADVFLDVVGEDLRARTYVFTDPEGQELCLRPDLTVPACRLYLARHPEADAAQRYCYNGSVFRFQPLGAGAERPNEFRQAGFELIGDLDAEQAETDALALVVKALSAAGRFDFQMRMGDLGLFRALLADLEMPERGRQRLRAQFWRPDAFRAALAGLTSTTPGSLAGLPPALVAVLDSVDPSGAEQAGAEQKVADHLQGTGIDLIGARSVAEITAGLLAAIEDAKAEPIPPGTARRIESYLTIQGPAPEAARSLARVIGDAGPRSAEAVTAFERRLKLMAAAGIDTAALSFSAEFGRNLEYYTGFVFDVISPLLGGKTPIAGGGRYDKLLRAAGAPRDVPAVGSAIHTERLLSVVNEKLGTGTNFSAQPSAVSATLEIGTCPQFLPGTRPGKLLLAIPSKGRLMEETVAAMACAGFALKNAGNERGYRREIEGEDDIDVIFVSASEIALQLKAGRVHVGVTGEDLIREEILNADERVEMVLKLGFGHADVVVAVPNCWVDVASMANLQETARTFRRRHGRRLRVATKYMHLTRTFFREKGVADYLIVESLGATEGTPASGTADMIVDITSTGSTLRANGLRILNDGVILKSEANLVASRRATRTPAIAAIEARVLASMRTALKG